MTTLGIAMNSDGDELELHVTPAYLRQLADQLETDNHVEIEGTAVDLDEPVTITVTYPNASPAPTPTAAHTATMEKYKIPTAGGVYIANHIEGDYILAVDSSGGMNPRANMWMHAVAALPNCREVIAFDDQVREVDPKDELVGAGGTDFRAVQDYVESYPRDINVLVLTDGYGPRITPTHPDRWTWAIMAPEGSLWPAEDGMKTYQTA